MYMWPHKHKARTEVGGGVWPPFEFQRRKWILEEFVLMTGQLDASSCSDQTQVGVGENHCSSMDTRNSTSTSVQESNHDSAIDHLMKEKRAPNKNCLFKLTSLESITIKKAAGDCAFWSRHNLKTKSIWTFNQRIKESTKSLPYILVYLTSTSKYKYWGGKKLQN